MATVWVDPPTHTVAIAAANTYVFRQASHGVVSRWILDLQSSSFSGSIAVVSRRSGTNDTFTAEPYTQEYVNGAVGDGTVGSAAITNTSIIHVDSTGKDVGLVVTYTSGTMNVTGVPVQG